MEINETGSTKGPVSPLTITKIEPLTMREVCIEKTFFDTGSNIIQSTVKITVKDDHPEIYEKALKLFDDLNSRKTINNANGKGI